MSNRLITVALLGIILSVFLIYFTLQRRAFPSGQPINRLFQEIIQDASLEEWDSAVIKSNRLKKEWEKHKFLIAFNYSETDYQVFEDTIYELTAAAETEETFETISRARKGQKLWKNFIKLIPEP